MPTSRLAQMAREREADRAAGRPERGLFTGRGRRHRADPDEYERFAGQHDMGATDGRESDADFDDDDDDDEYDNEYTHEYEDGAREASKPRPRTGAKRTVLHAIRQIPQYLRMLIGLMRDSRVSRLDRLLVVAAAAYIISPLDFIPDFIPFLGEVDDIFLLMLALQRLVDNSGVRVLRDHWRGHPDDLSEMNLSAMVSAAAFFLPGGIRRKLTRMATRRSR